MSNRFFTTLASVIAQTASAATLVATAVIAQAAITQTACAADERGNGGHGLRCGTGNAATLEAYDRFEARQYLRLPPDFGPETSDPTAMALRAVKRLKPLDPVRAGRLAKWIRTFMAEARFVEGPRFTPIHDADPLRVPAACELQVVVAQVTPPYPEAPRYIIDSALWRKLSVVDQAYLVLHEVIYREALARGAESSKETRTFNAHLASASFSTWTMAQYRAFTRQLKFLPEIIRVGGLDVDGASAKRGEDGTVIEAMAPARQTSFDASVYTSGNLRFDMRTARGLIAGLRAQTEPIRLEFAPDGSLAGAEPIADVFVGKTRFSSLWGGRLRVEGDQWRLRFNDLSVVNRCGYATANGDWLIPTATGVPFSVENGTLTLKYGLHGDVVFRGTMSFYPSGNLRQGTLAASAALFDTTGHRRQLTAGTVVNLTENCQLKAKEQ